MKRTVLLFAGLFSLASAFAANDSQVDAELLERIKPVGNVYVEGAEVAEVPAAPTGPRTGKQVFDTSCMSCHASGVMGAPKPGDAGWETRKAQGMDVLLQHALEGFNAMPPRGTCMNCSDDEIQAAIDYMIEGK